MRIRVILIAFICVLNTSTFANNFDGPYVGVGLGFVNANFSANKTAEVDTVFFNLNTSNKLKPYQNNFSGSVALGYTHIFIHKLSLAIEAAANYAHGNDGEVSVIQEVVTSLNDPSYMSFSFRRNFSFLIKPGFMAGPDSLLYGITGLRFGKFQVSNSESYYQDILGLVVFESEIPFTTDNIYKCGFALGAGLQQYIGKGFNVSLEYIYTYYGKLRDLNYAAPLTTNGVADGTYKNSINNLSARTNTFSLNLLYRF